MHLQISDQIVTVYDNLPDDFKMSDVIRFVRQFNEDFVTDRFISGLSTELQRMEKLGIIHSPLGDRDKSVSEKLWFKEFDTLSGWFKWRVKKREEKLTSGWRGWKSGPSSKEHRRLKYKAIRALELKGFEVKEEYRVRVDVVGLKNGHSIAVECGNCHKEKLRYLTEVFDTVLHMPYNSKPYIVKQVGHE